LVVYSLEAKRVISRGHLAQRILVSMVLGAGLAVVSACSSGQDASSEESSKETARSSETEALGTSSDCYHPSYYVTGTGTGISTGLFGGSCDDAKGSAEGWAQFNLTAPGSAGARCTNAGGTLVPKATYFYQDGPFSWNSPYSATLDCMSIYGGVTVTAQVQTCCVMPSL
jgi:hypothetical protein